jgi:hypothetical protein
MFGIINNEWHLSKTVEDFQKSYPIWNAGAIAYFTVLIIFILWFFTKIWAVLTGRMNGQSFQAASQTASKSLLMIVSFIFISGTICIGLLLWLYLCYAAPH